MPRLQLVVDPQRGVGGRPVLHVDAHEVAVAARNLDQPLDVAVAELLVELQAEVRGLDMDVAVEAELADGREHLVADADAGENILAAALRAGVALPYGCRDGACGNQ